ncbi:MAG: hypothetical protein AAB474_02660 [Patescibacteria group bacterium]
MNGLIIKILTIALLMLGRVAYAKPVKEILTKFLNEVINPLIYVIFGLALLIFLWGVVEFIAKAGSEEARTTGKQHIIWGLVGLTIMLGVFGIINILKSLFF